MDIAHVIFTHMIDKPAHVIFTLMIILGRGLKPIIHSVTGISLIKVVALTGLFGLLGISGLSKGNNPIIHSATDIFQYP